MICFILLTLLELPLLPHAGKEGASSSPSVVKVSCGEIQTHRTENISPDLFSSHSLPGASHSISDSAARDGLPFAIVWKARAMGLGGGSGDPGSVHFLPLSIDPGGTRPRMPSAVGWKARTPGPRRLAASEYKFRKHYLGLPSAFQ